MSDVAFNIMYTVDTQSQKDISSPYEMILLTRPNVL